MTLGGSREFRGFGLKLEGGHHFIVAANVLEPLALVLSESLRGHGKRKVFRAEAEGELGFRGLRNMERILIYGWSWRENTGGSCWTTLPI